MRAFLLLLLSISLPVQAQHGAASPLPAPATMPMPTDRFVPTVTLRIPLDGRAWRGLSTRAWLEMGAVTSTGVGHLAASSD